MFCIGNPYMVFDKIANSAQFLDDTLLFKLEHILYAQKWLKSFV